MFLLVHLLLDGLPQHTRLSVDAGAEVGAEAGALEVADEAVLQRELVRALDAELRALAAREPRCELHPLEITTDLAAQRLRIAIV